MGGDVIPVIPDYLIQIFLIDFPCLSPEVDAFAGCCYVSARINKRPLIKAFCGYLGEK
jgi:hypothetical protein